VLQTLGLSERDVEAANPRRGAGCAECGGTGYHGRTGIFEVLPVTSSLRAVLMATPNEGAVADASRKAGMQTLRASAIAKAQAGITTYEEVLRATQVDASDEAHCGACGAAVDEDMVACPFCATAVSADRCPSCARPTEAPWRICPYCREALPGRGAPMPAAPSEPAAALPKLLVVDDDENILGYVAAALEGVVDVDTTTTASAGLEMIGVKEYDGVLIDQRLPDLTGVEMIRLLRSEAHTAALPVMLFTGEVTEGLETDATEMGVEGVLIKPVDPALLEERILALVALSGRVA
jgi:CheY-like chemotaxis protein